MSKVEKSAQEAWTDSHISSSGAFPQATFRKLSDLFCYFRKLSERQSSYTFKLMIIGGRKVVSEEGFQFIFVDQSHSFIFYTFLYKNTA